MTHSPTIANAARSTARSLSTFWRRLTTHMFVGYRPERHYMRGPGPKWHERNSPRPR